MSDKLARSGPLPSRQLIARILDEPQLVVAVQRLDARALGKLIDHVGLEDAGELIALATTEQLARLFDEDLWTSGRAGEEERFDAQRFSLWLQVMLEVGEEFAARKLAELPEELVTLALHRQVLVIDLDALALQMSESRGGAEPLEKALESTLNLEIDQYRVIALQHEGWDALAAVLLALDEKDPAFLRRLLERLCHAGSELVDDNGGLYEVLTSAEMLESDAAGEREDRRARQGFVAPAQGTAFLKLARATPLGELIAATGRDPITRAYFREYEEPVVTSDLRNQEEAARPLVEVLAEAEVLPAEQAPLLLEGAAATEESRYRRAVGELEGAAQAERLRELSYLANVLVAAGTHRGQRFRMLDAAEAALAVCNLGAETLARARQPWDAIVAQPADKLFRIGLHRLHHEVQSPSLRALKEARGKPTEARRASLRALAEDVPALLRAGRRQFIATEKLISIAKNEIEER